MKRGSALLSLAVGLLFAAGGLGAVYAQQNSASPEAQRKARIDERRAKTSTNLSAAEANRVSGLCVAAQAKAKSVQKKLTDNQQPYRTKFDTYIKQLKTLQEKLQADGKNTSDMQRRISELEQKYKAYTDSLDNLSTTMEDLTVMDCKSEPNGFKATLEEARTQIKDVQTARKNLNAYARESIVQMLQSLKGAN